MVLEEQLAKINDKFKMEISVIKEYLEFRLSLYNGVKRS
jgi:hypothetical protein